MSSDSFRYSRGFVLFCFFFPLSVSPTHKIYIQVALYLYAFGQSYFHSSIIIGVERNMKRIYVLIPNNKFNIVDMKSLILKKSRSGGKNGNICQPFSRFQLMRPWESAWFSS